MKRRWPLCLAFIGGAMTVVGCTAPEQWSAFDVDWDKAKQKADVPPATRPTSTLPTSTLPALDLPADGPLTLSIEQAAFIALSRNRDLAVQQLTPRINGAFELIERGAFDPELFGEAQYEQEVASETATSTREQFSIEGNDVTFTGGIRQFLPSGTNLEFNASQRRSVSNRAPEQQEARLGVSITQALLRGAGPAVNLVAIRQAKLDTIASVYELRRFTEVLLGEVESAYWRYVLAKRQIEIFERSLAVAEKQRDDVHDRIDVGLIGETESAAAEAEAARRKQDLIDARADLEAQRLRLLRLLSPDVEGTFDRTLDLTTPLEVTPEPMEDWQDRAKLAEKMRPDLGEARLRLEQNRLQTIVTRNGLLPQLDLFIDFGKTSFGNTIGNTFRTLDDGNYEVSGGVRLSQFIGNDAARGRNIAAFANRQQSLYAIENLREQIHLDVRLALNEVERARQQISASTTTRQLQEKTLAAEQERFNVGSSTALLVAQAQRDLVEAEINEVEAMVSYRLALITLYVSEGSLLERRGVTVETDGTLAQ